MKILLIPDKFKESLSSEEVSTAIASGIKKFNPLFETQSLVVSDGGDGFLSAVKENTPNLSKIDTDTVDPLGRPIKSYYLFQQETSEAFIELAKASGLHLIEPASRNIMNASTFGTGVQIADAVKRGALKISIGLGGSATNDGGMGIATALGFEFRDKNDQILTPSGHSLSKIECVDRPSSKLLDSIVFNAINDVQNELFGLNGAAYIYGPQKGASDTQVQELDGGLQNLHQKVKVCLGVDAAFHPGAGAAGGAAYGLRVFFNANFISGVDFVLQKQKIDQKLSKGQYQLIITGEGRIDDQTNHGKLVKGVAKLGGTYNIPVIAVCGKNDLKKVTKEQIGLKAIVQSGDISQSLEFNMKHAAVLLENAVLNYFINQDQL